MPGALRQDYPPLLETFQVDLHCLGGFVSFRLLFLIRFLLRFILGFRLVRFFRRFFVRKLRFILLLPVGIIAFLVGWFLLLFFLLFFIFGFLFPFIVVARRKRRGHVFAQGHRHQSGGVGINPGVVQITV